MRLCLSLDDERISLCEGHKTVVMAYGSLIPSNNLTVGLVDLFSLLSFANAISFIVSASVDRLLDVNSSDSCNI